MQMYRVKVEIMDMQQLHKIQMHHPIVVMEEFSEFQAHQQVA